LVVFLAVVSISVGAQDKPKGNPIKHSALSESPQKGGYHDKRCCFGCWVAYNAKHSGSKPVVNVGPAVPVLG
jgi:hypothetical protein